MAITNGQYSLMMSLNRPEPPTIGSVAALLAMDRTTLTAALKPLERRGLVTISVDEADRRGRRLALTAGGLALLAEATPIWIATHGQVEAELGAGGADTLRGGLRAIG